MNIDDFLYIFLLNTSITMIKSKKQRKAVYPKTESKERAEELTGQPQLLEAQHAKHMLTEISMGCSCHEKQEQQWGNSTFLENYPQKTKRGSPQQPNQKNNPKPDPLDKKIFYSTKQSQLNPSKVSFMTQYKYQNYKHKSRSYSSINLDFQQSSKDKRIHSTNNNSSSFSKQPIEPFRKTIFNFMGSERNKIQSRTVGDHKCAVQDGDIRRTEDSLRTIDKYEKQVDRYSFGLVQTLPKPRKVSLLYPSKKSREFSKRASLISSMVRIQIRKKNEQTRLRQRKLQIMNEKNPFI